MRTLALTGLAAVAVLVGCGADERGRGGGASDAIQSDATDADSQSDALSGDSADGAAATDGWAADCEEGKPCDDFDPCTLNDTCAAGVCHGSHNICQDEWPCTLDRCEPDGSCSHKPNQHWDCTPDIVIDFPPRGYASNAPDALLSVKGHLNPVSEVTLPVSNVTVQGQKVAVVDNHFEVTVPLQPGQQRLEVVVADALGNERRWIQGVEYATTWREGGEAVAAGALGASNSLVGGASSGDATSWLDGQQVALANLDFVAQRPCTGQPVPVAFGLRVGKDPLASAFDFAVPLETVAMPEASTAVAADALTVPLAVACSVTTDPLLGETNGKLRYALLIDALNVALHHAFVAGALDDDATSLTFLLGVPISMVATLHGTMPWRLHGCGAQLTLSLTDLQLSADAAMSGLPLSAVVWLGFDVPAVLQVQGGFLELWLGETAEFSVAMSEVPSLYLGTDFHIGTEDILRQKVLPTLMQTWRAAPLVRLPLPGLVATSVLPMNGLVWVE